jgi:hypothetical protein
MSTPARPPSRWLTIAGLVAAAALVVRGLLDLQDTGWALLLVAGAILAALALRWLAYRR